MGYLSQAPLLKESPFLRDPSLAPQLHNCINQLIEITKQDYSRFKVTINPDSGESYIRNTEYRSKINGLIMNLHAQYFNDETTPFSGTPSTIVQQSQNQNILTQIIMITEFQSLIDKQLYSSSNNLDEKQKSFLEKLKGVLPTLKSATELITAILTLAQNLGLDISQIKKAFGI